MKKKKKKVKKRKFYNPTLDQCSDWFKALYKDEKDYQVKPRRKK